MVARAAEENHKFVLRKKAKLPHSISKRTQTENIYDKYNCSVDIKRKI